MTTQPRIAALIADGFQEEECLVPRFVLKLLGARVDIVSSVKAPVAIYRYFGVGGRREAVRLAGMRGMLDANVG